MLNITEQKKKYSRTVKCPHCEEQVDRNIEPFAEHGNRYYHQKCYDERDAGSKDRRELLDYITKLYDGEVSYPLVTKQIKDLIEEYNFTVKGIELTLRYFYDIEGNSLSKSKGIGIVPYAYEDAKKYFGKLVKIKNSVMNMEHDIQTQTVYTTPEKTKRKRKKIDIGGI